MSQVMGGKKEEYLLFKWRCGENKFRLTNGSSIKKTTERVSRLRISLREQLSGICAKNLPW